MSTHGSAARRQHWQSRRRRRAGGRGLGARTAGCPGSVGRSVPGTEDDRRR